MGIGGWIKGGVLCSAFTLFLGQPAFAKITYSEFQTYIRSNGAELDLISLPKSEEELKDLVKKSKSRLQNGVARILKRPLHEASVSNTVLALDGLLNDFSKAINQVMILVAQDGESSLGKMARDQRAILFQLHEDLFLNEALYHRLNSMSGMKGLDSEQKRLLEVLLESFTIASKKAEDVVEGWELRGLNKELTETVEKFSANLYQREPLKFTLAELKGLPQEYLDRMPRDGKHYLVDGGQWGQWDPIMRLVEIEETRRLVFLNVKSGAPEANVKLVELMRVGRGRKATRLGYRSWADYQLDNTSENPRSLLGKFARVRKLSEGEFRNEKKQIRKRLGRPSQPWDLLFVREQMAKEQGVDEASIRGYFEWENVLDGMLRFVENAFELKIEEVEGAPVWQQARVFSVSSEADSKPLGIFLLDPYVREGKEPWFMVQNITAAETLSNGVQKLASTLLHLSMEPPDKDGVKLLTFEEVYSLFHEMGHVLHELLPNQKYFFLNPDGSNADLIEYPALVLERLAWEPEVIASYAKDYRTGNPMPSDLIEKLSASRTNLGFHWIRARAAESVLDLKLHGARRTGLERLEQEVLSEYYYAMPAGLLISPSLRWLEDYDAFGWIYSAADALADHEISKFRAFPGGVMGKGAGAAFRRGFLEAGSRYTSDQLIERTAGKDYNFCTSLLGSARPPGAAKKKKR